MAGNVQQQTRKILWAVDALTEDKKLQEVTARVLRTLGSQVPLDIEPVVAILEAQIPYLVGPDYGTRDFQRQITAEVQKWLGTLNLPNLRDPKLLVEKTFSVRAAVQNLLNYAKKNHFEFIVAGTHAKDRAPENGKELGTFAESLFLTADISVLFVNPKMTVPGRFSSVFFPTDLSAVSLAALNRMIPFVIDSKLPLSVFHKIDPVPQGAIRFLEDSHTRSRFLEQEYEARRSKLKEIASQIEKQGAKVEVIVEQISHDYVSHSILERAPYDSLMAMVSSTSEGKAFLPGSVTRQVLRAAQVPVLVLPPKEPQL